MHRDHPDADRHLESEEVSLMVKTSNDGRATLRDILDMQREMDRKIDEVTKQVACLDSKFTGAENRIKGVAAGISAAVSVAAGIIIGVLDHFLRRP